MFFLALECKGASDSTSVSSRGHDSVESNLLGEPGDVGCQKTKDLDVRTIKGDTLELRDRY